MFFYKNSQVFFCKHAQKHVLTLLESGSRIRGGVRQKGNKTSKKGNRIRANLTPLKTVTWGHGLASGIMDQKHTCMTCGCDTTGFAKYVPIPTLSAFVSAPFSSNMLTMAS